MRWPTVGADALLSIRFPNAAARRFEPSGMGPKCGAPHILATIKDDKGRVVSEAHARGSNDPVSAGTIGFRPKHRDRRTAVNGRKGGASAASRLGHRRPERLGIKRQPSDFDNLLKVDPERLGDPTVFVQAPSDHVRENVDETAQIGVPLFQGKSRLLYHLRGAGLMSFRHFSARP